MTRADFTTCGRNIFPAPNRSPTTPMPSMSGPSMTSSGRPPAAAISWRSSSVSSTTWSSMPLTSACVISSRTGSERHCSTVASAAAPLSAYSPAISSSRSAASGRRPSTASSMRSRVDAPHVHAGADRVEEEDGVDRLAHRVVAAEGERDVRDAAADERTRQVLLDPAGGLDEVEPVPGVLLDAGRDREHVGVEDDVLGREPDLLDEDPVGPRADLLAPLQVVRLAVLVERHDDDGGPVPPAQPRLRDERL